MKISTIYFLLTVLAVSPLLAACSSSCDCPRCPEHSSTTVVTPPNSSTTTYPEE